MIDVYKLFLMVQSDVNTSQGGWFTPEVFNGWAEEEVKEMHREMFKSWEKSQKVDDEYGNPFLKSANIILQLGGSQPFDIAVYPEGYMYFSSCGIYAPGGQSCLCKDENGEFLPIIDGNTGKECKKEDDICSRYVDPDVVALADYERDANLTIKQVVKVDNQRWNALFQHSRRKPTRDRPYITQTDTGFKVAPKGIGVIVLDYMVKPAIPKLVYTIGVDDSIVYNQGASTQIDWNDQLVSALVKRISKRYAKYVQDQFLYQANESERQLSS